MFDSLKQEYHHVDEPMNDMTDTSTKSSLHAVLPKRDANLHEKFGLFYVNVQQKQKTMLSSQNHCNFVPNLIAPSTNVHYFPYFNHQQLQQQTYVYQPLITSSSSHNSKILSRNFPKGEYYSNQNYNQLPFLQMPSFASHAAETDYLPLCRHSVSQIPQETAQVNPAINIQDRTGYTGSLLKFKKDWLVHHGYAPPCVKIMKSVPQRVVRVRASYSLTT